MDLLCRAYKLGKKRWSYNQVELIMHNDEDESQLQVVEAVQHSPPALTDAQKVCGVCKQPPLLGSMQTNTVHPALMAY